MSGARLGRGRGARLAIYAGCGAVVVLLVFAYRAAVAEMARLRDSYEQCAHQQEALSAQLQVIFEYKAHLEKSLVEEKSSNAAVKQELQQRATREKSLRDKDTVEAMHRYNSLQQAYKTRETELQDLQAECDKRQSLALENSHTLENTLRDVRAELKAARDDKVRSLEQLKNKYDEIEVEKKKLEDKYNELVKNAGDSGQTARRLEQENLQLRKELEKAQRSSGGNVAAPSLGSPSNGGSAPQPLESVNQGSKGGSESAKNLAKPPSQQQNTSTTASRSQTTKLVGEIMGKASTLKPVTQPEEKVQVSERMKVKKIPAGVPPIPMMFEADRKPVATNSKLENGRGADAAESNNPKEKPALAPVVDDPELPKVAPIGRHNVNQPLGQKEAREWQHKPQHGVQEVGDELNQLENIAGLDDTGIHAVGEGAEYAHYDGGDYDKEPPMKNNDIHIEEGEDEAEDEDDPMDYEGNNLKADKHPE